MRKRWLLGLLAVVGLTLVVTKATTMAQRSEGPKPAPRWRTAGEPTSKAAEIPTLLPPGLSRTEPSVGDDPMGTVDAFLQRSRKEADESIKALGQEAEALRSRLQKVEAALARWQGVSQALNQEPKALSVNPPTTRPEAVKPSEDPLPTISNDPVLLPVSPDPKAVAGPPPPVRSPLPATTNDTGNPQVLPPPPR